ncbi:MAG TPA: hypothetical protein VFS27_06635 [Blastocatellia bacterium]|nr:hypothetical protein [Blastocatellia bacterium]
MAEANRAFEFVGRVVRLAPLRASRQPSLTAGGRKRMVQHGGSGLVGAALWWLI